MFHHVYKLDSPLHHFRFEPTHIAWKLLELKLGHSPILIWDLKTPTYCIDASSSPMCACHWPNIDATPQSKLTTPFVLQSLTWKWLPYAFILWYLHVFLLKVGNLMCLPWPSPYVIVPEWYLAPIPQKWGNYSLPPPSPHVLPYYLPHIYWRLAKWLYLNLSMWKNYHWAWSCHFLITIVVLTCN